MCFEQSEKHIRSLFYKILKPEHVAHAKVLESYKTMFTNQRFVHHSNEIL